MASQDWMTKDFYKVLGVSKDADQQAIKKAYRKLARTYHPDQNPGDTAAEERFKEIGEAYSVLSDTEKRKQYDALRAMAGGGARFHAGPGGGASGSFADVFGSMFGGATGPGAGGFGSSRVRFGSGGASGFEDVFSGLFGGAGAGGFQQRPPRGDDLRSTARLTLNQAVEGATLKLSVEGREMTVRIPPGVNDGQKLRLKGKGRQVPGGEPGDLLLTINLEKHPIFTLRDGTNLLFDLPITVGEAVNGATVEVPVLDGSTTRMKVPAGTSSGVILRLRGRGVKAHGKRRAGDLLARVQIVVPDHPGRAIKHAAREFDDAAGIDPRAEWSEQS